MVSQRPQALPAPFLEEVAASLVTPSGAEPDPFERTARSLLAALLAHTQAEAEEL